MRSVDTTKNELQIPSMRDTLIHYLNKLSDHELRRAVWSKSAQQPGTDYDDLDYPLTFLYDDTDLSTNSVRWIGVILKNQEELDAVDKLTDAIDAVFDKYDYGLKDEEYIQKPEWQEVLTTAKTTFDLIKAR